MFGAIIPEPLAMPPMRTVLPPTRTSTAAALGTRSVVMIARAMASPCAGVRPRRAAASRMPDSTFASGSGTPMMPVLATRNRPGAAPAHSAAIFDMRRASRRPFAPVQALAFPAFTTTPRTGPCFRSSRSNRTGAACTRLVVKTAAATAGRSVRIRPRSGTPGRVLMPHRTPAQRKPFAAMTPPGIRRMPLRFMVRTTPPSREGPA